MSFRSWSFSRKYPFVVFLILACAIGLVGYFNYDIQKRKFTKHINNELSTVADLKVGQITSWRNERLEDAAVIQNNPVLAATVQQYLQNPAAAGHRRDLLAWMRSLLKTSHYKSIVLVDTLGQMMLSTSPDRRVSSPYAKKLVRDALRSGHAILSDMHRSPVFPHPHLGLVVPLSVQQGKESVFIGALLFRIDPESFLYPLIHSWPDAHKSAETVLIRKEGNSVLFLSRLRHRNDPPLSFRVQLDEKRAPNVSAILQERGIFEGLDYREVPVLAATQSVPHTSWDLVSKVDVEEVYAPVRRQARLFVFIIVVLITSAGLLILLWWFKETAEQRETYYKSELALKTLSQKYDLLSKFSNDIIYLIDEAGNIKEINDRAVKAYGYTREELLRLSVWDIRPAETHLDIPRQMQQVRGRKGMIFETVHKRKDGSKFPVEISSSVIAQDGVIFFQCVVRDITERKQAEIALLNQRNWSQSIVAAIGDGISIQDLNFNVLYQNDIHKDMIGDHIGEYCYQAYEHLNETCEGCAVAASFKDGKIHTAERSVQTDRGEMHVEVTASPLRDETGAIIAGIEVVRNMTARKFAERDLLRERDRIQRYLDLAGVILVAIGADQKILLINRMGCKLLGRNEQELIGRNWFDTALLSSHREEVKSVFDRIMSGDMAPAEYFENIIVSKTGEQHLISWHNTTLKNDAGNIIGTLSSGQDITSRKQTERALVESEQHYKRLIESVTDYIYSVEVENGRIVRTRFGPGCFMVTGYTSEEYWNDPDLWKRIIFDADRDMAIEQMNKIFDGKAMTSPFEHRIIHRDGSIRWIRNSAVPHLDAEGLMISYDGLITDITQLKTLENQLRQAQKMEAVGQLAGGVAHDFNNILTAIIGYGHLLLMKIPENDPARAFVDPILISAERAAHLTSSLLAFSRKQIVDLRPVELNAIIRQVEHLLSRIIGENFDFQTRLADENLIVMADTVQIEQILMNLSTNARDSMPNGGTLLFETEVQTLGEDFIRAHSYGVPGKYVCLSVKDNGFGMDENTRSRIFEPFFTTKEVGKGTGLGLSMVYGIIKQHNGFIEVSSALGKGTTFKIYFPLHATAAVGKPFVGPDSIEWRGTETVLVAEDNRPVLDLTRCVLENTGYTVIEAVDGEDAVQKFVDNKETIDLLIIDMIMPKKNGKEVYLEIKKTHPDIKVLFMSGYTADDAHKKGLLDVGFDVILKPVTPSDLLRKVREQLDGK